MSSIFKTGLNLEMPSLSWSNTHPSKGTELTVHSFLHTMYLLLRDNVSNFTSPMVLSTALLKPLFSIFFSQLRTSVAWEDEAVLPLYVQYISVLQTLGYASHFNETFWSSHKHRIFSSVTKYAIANKADGALPCLSPNCTCCLNFNGQGYWAACVSPEKQLGRTVL